MIFRRRPEPIADPGGSAPGPPAPLIGRGAGDPDGGETSHAGAGRESWHPGETGVDHHPHPINGQAGFRDGGREQHLAVAGRSERGRCPVRREKIAVERIDRPDCPPVPRSSAVRRISAWRGGRPGYRPHPPRVNDARRRRRRFDAGVGPPCEMSGFHREAPPRAGDDRRATEQRGDRRAIERSGHDEHPEIGPQNRARLDGQRETEIGVQAPLVELVEDDHAGGLERRIGLQHASENALGEHLDAGGGAYHAVAPDAVADGGTGWLVKSLPSVGLRHERRGGGVRAGGSCDRPATMFPEQSEWNDVVLPAPGGACSTADPDRARARASSGRTPSMGRPVGFTGQAYTRAMGAKLTACCAANRQRSWFGGTRPAPQRGSADHGRGP